MRKKLIGISLALIIILNLNFSVVLQYINQSLYINFIDVGQGDSTLIRYKGINILIDGGGNDYDYDIGKNVLAPVLLKKKINIIKYL